MVLSDLVEIMGGGTPKTTEESYWNGDIPWLSVKDFCGNKKYVYKTEKTITQVGLDNSSTKILRKDNIIISARGTVGEVAMIPFNMAFNQSCFGLIAKANNDPHFIYYLLKDKVRTLKSQAQGSVFDTITKSTFDQVECESYSLSDQRRIASLLSSLDRKIELNNKINAELEEMAQAIFKNWFVDFEPFKDGKFKDSELGRIPEGWEVGTVGEYCKCLLGGTPSRNKEEYWNGNINWINSGEINKFRIIEPSEKITEKGLAKSATKLLPKKTTVLAITGATLGQISLLEVETCANQSVIGILENKTVPYEFIYPFIKDRICMLIRHQTGGAQQHINKDNVESLTFLLPDKNTMHKYQTLVSPIYKKIECLCFESSHLSTLRDTLLPRLMSGEIEIPE